MTPSALPEELAPSQINSYQIGISWSTTGAGGSARVFLDLARHLPAQGVAFYGAVGAPANASEVTGGAVESFAGDGASTPERLIGARKVMLKAMDRLKPDLVASHFALFAAPIRDKLRLRPHVVHFHGPWAAESVIEGAGKVSAFAKGLIERSVYSTGDRVIVLSNAFAEIVSKDYGVPEEIVRIIPGAVDVSRFNVVQTRHQAREILGWPTDRVIMISVRRLVNRMGLDRLVEAFAAVHGQSPDSLLYLVGKGKQRESLERRVKELGMEEAIRFQGFVPDDLLPLVYRAADLSVVPTVALEGFGLVAAESLAAGTPCVVTPVGGLPDIVSTLSSNLVLKSIETRDLTDALGQILAGKVDLPSAEQCLEHVVKNFTVGLMAQRTAAVYREAIG